jgi:hypothetical protein
LSKQHGTGFDESLLSYITSGEWYGMSTCEKEKSQVKRGNQEETREGVSLAFIITFSEELTKVHKNYISSF